MNLLPMWWRLGSVSELKPYPPEERRRLWALAARRKVSWKESFMLGGLLVVMFMLLEVSFERWFGSSRLLLSWATLIKTMTGGFLQLSPVSLGRIIFQFFVFLIFFHIYAQVGEKSTLRRLREMLQAGDLSQKRT